METKYKIIIFQVDKGKIEQTDEVNLFAEGYSQLLMLLTAVKLGFDNEKFINNINVFEINDDGTETHLLLNHVKISF